MKAVNEITKILSAMGANPTTETDRHGREVIKVNAPIINNGVRLEINDKQYFIPQETLADFEVIEE